MQTCKTLTLGKVHFFVRAFMTFSWNQVTNNFLSLNVIFVCLFSLIRQERKGFVVFCSFIFFPSFLWHWQFSLVFCALQYFYFTRKGNFLNLILLIHFCADVLSHLYFTWTDFVLKRSGFFILKLAREEHSFKVHRNFLFTLRVFLSSLSRG